MFGNGGWMTGELGGMMGAGGMLMMLLFWVGLIFLIVWVVRSVVGTSQATGSSMTRQTMDQRYARGELTRKEYDQMKKDIGG